jgi:hypothetical protein
MVSYTQFILKALRKLYSKVKGKGLSKPKYEENADIVSQLIFDALISDKPTMIARFGSTELTCLMNYIGVEKEKVQICNYIKGKTNPWWWEKNIINQMQVWSGFFPTTNEKIKQFCELMLEDLKEVDVLGSWLAEEIYFENQLKNALKVELNALEPYFAAKPWTMALEGKKVLIIHPFQKTIENQYKKRLLLFENNLLPGFELITLKAVQSIAGEKTNYADWFEALEYMKNEIDKCDFDICIIGAGAYGFPLAAHVKRIGKKAFHLGGSTQLLFGIKGKRWDDSGLYNEYWVSPSVEETPNAKDKVENGCYW